MLARGELTAGHARALITSDNPVELARCQQMLLRLAAPRLKRHRPPHASADRHYQQERARHEKHWPHRQPRHQ